MALLQGEKIIFADKVKKTNMFEWTQERILVLTTVGLYNIHKKEVKRKIMIEDIGGLTKTVPPSKAMEFTVHVPIKYDYRYSSQKREEIIELLKKLYIIVKEKNCPIFHTTKKDVKEFTTTESDMKKARTRFPAPELRYFGEDILV